jgi:DNA polymerase III subunit gamma/tau
MVFYRKYRPQKIDELDSTLIREKLSSILLKDSFHAFLFTGPKGLGKTSTARIVAKVLNCETRKKNEVEPCNKCYQCTSITNGTNIDVLEIDAASNRGIDEIRDLREKIKLSTAAAKKKVYIIDEVHMLTSEAFNALLKTLEEPPSHVVFILCTTEPQKVPATIASRCLHIPFTFATKEELVRSLKRIVSKEKINIEPDALERVASLSDGSFRDAAKILEEIVSQTGNRKITGQTVEDKYQISNIQYQINQLLESLLDKDTKKGLKLAQDLTEQGIEMKYFLEQVVNALHSLMLAKVGISEAKLNGQLSEKLTLEEIKKLLSLFSRANVQLKYAVLPQLPLELAIIEWSVQDEQTKGA